MVYSIVAVMMVIVAVVFVGMMVVGFAAAVAVDYLSTFCAAVYFCDVFVLFIFWRSNCGGCVCVCVFRY